MKKKIIVLSTGLLFVSGGVAPIAIKSYLSKNNIQSIKQNANKISIKFDANGGSLSGLETIDTTNEIAFKNITNKPTATLNGIASSAWCYDKDGTNPVDVDQPIASSTTLYAKYALYDVTFNAGDGEFAGGGKTKTFSKINKIHRDEVEVPTCTGKAFEGWYIGETKQSFPYVPSDTVTLTAKYTTNVVSLSYYAGDGTFGSSKSFTADVAYGTKWSDLTASQKPSDPTISSPDKIFADWKINKSSISADYEFKTDTLIKASYQDAITVTFDIATNGGQWVGTESSTAKSAKIKLGSEESNPTFAQFKSAAGVTTSRSKEGSYDELGWFFESTAENDAITDDYKFTTSGTKTVYAYYKVPHTVSFDSGKDTSYEVTSGSTEFVRKDSLSYTIVNKTGYSLPSKDNVSVTYEHGEGTTWSYNVNDAKTSATLTISNAPGSNVSITIGATQNEYVITPDTTSGGVASLKITKDSSDVTKAHYNDTIKVEATVDTGYSLTEIQVIKTGTSTVYKTIATGETFTMPDCAVTIKPVTVHIEYDIAKDTTSYGGITSISTTKGGSEVSEAYYNDTIKVEVAVDTGYSLSEIQVINTSSSETYATIATGGTFTMPSYAVTIKPVTVHNTYVITSDTSTTGLKSLTVTKGGSVVTEAYYNDTIKVEAEANTGYTLTNIKVINTETSETYATIASGETFTMPAYKVTIRATISVNSYLVSFNPNGGTISGGTEYTYADYDTLIKDCINGRTATHDDKKFKGWSKDGTTVIKDTDKIEGNTTLTALWETYNVQISAVNGTIEEGSTSLSNVNVVHSDDIKATANDHYHFDHYEYCLTEEGTYVTTTMPLTLKNISGITDGATVYIRAVFSIDQVEVVFDANGGTIEGEETKIIEVDYGATWGSISKPTPTAPTGKSFVCWTYPDGTTIDDSTPIEDLLYVVAKYE